MSNLPNRWAIFHFCKFFVESIWPFLIGSYYALLLKKTKIFMSVNIHKSYIFSWWFWYLFDVVFADAFIAACCRIRNFENIWALLLEFNLQNNNYNVWTKFKKKGNCERVKEWPKTCRNMGKKRCLCSE